VNEKPKSGRAEASPALAEAPASSDVVLVHGVSEDGKSLAVLRARNNTLEAGVVRPLVEGEPIAGEVVRLKPRAEFPVVCDVEVTVPRAALAPQRGEGSAGEPGQRRHGPAQVATASYRDNWDAIWHKPGKGERQLN